MPIDPSIPLQARGPDLPTPQQMISLQNLVQQGQAQRMQMAQALKEQRDTNAIQQIVRDPASTDEQGFYTPTTLKKISDINWQVGQSAAGLVEKQKLTLQDIRAKQTQDLLNQQQLEKNLGEWQRDVIGTAVDRVKAETKGQQLSPEKEDDLFQKYYKEEQDRRKASGQWMYNDDKGIGERMFTNISNARMTFQTAQIQSQTAKERRVSEKEAATEKRGEETPFVKELLAAGYKPGTKEYQDQLKKHLAKMDAPTQTMISMQPMDPGGLLSASAQASTGMPLSQVVPGYGAAAAQKREQIREGAINYIKSQNPGMTDAQAGEELARRSTDFVAGRRSVTQLTTMLGATKQAVQQLEFNIDKTKDVLKRIPSTNLSPLFNAIIRGEERWTGDPKYAELYFYMHATAMESARILQGGQASVAQLHAGAAEEAKKWADANMTPKMFIEGAAPAILAEGRFRVKSYQDAIKSQGVGGSPMPPVSGAPAQKAYQGPKLPTPKSVQDAMKLPPGTRFIDPNGVERTR